MKLVQVAEQNKPYYSADYTKGFNDGAKRQYTADVQEVKHGRWILGGEIGWPKWTCSVCGGDGRGDYKLCPWCGAKMDLEENDG